MRSLALGKPGDNGYVKNNEFACKSGVTFEKNNAEKWDLSWDQLEEAILNYFSRGLAHPAVARAVMQRAEDLEKENEVLTAKVDEFRHGEEQFKIQLKNAMQVIQNENQQIENLREANVKCKENYDRMSIALTTIRDQRSEQILKFLKDLEKWVNVNCTEPTPTKPGILYTVLIREKLRGVIREVEEKISLPGHPGRDAHDQELDEICPLDPTRGGLLQVMRDAGWMVGEITECATVEGPRREWTFVREEIIAGKGKTDIEAILDAYSCCMR